LVKLAVAVCTGAEADDVVEPHDVLAISVAETDAAVDAGMTDLESLLQTWMLH